MKSLDVFTHHLKVTPHRCVFRLLLCRCIRFVKEVNPVPGSYSTLMRELTRWLAFIRLLVCHPAGSIHYIMSELHMVLGDNNSNCTTSYCNLRITVLTSVSPMVYNVQAQEWPYCSLGFILRSLACSSPGWKKNQTLGARLSLYLPKHFHWWPQLQSQLSLADVASIFGLWVGKTKEDALDSGLAKDNRAR